MRPRTVVAGIRLALLAAAPGALAVGCDQHASPTRDETGPATPPSERARVLGPFLDEYWRLPVAPQGPAPVAFSKAEAALDPQLCGACHPKQHREWLTSLHAGAFSPGFAGQLVEGALAAPAQVRNCQTCHAPLAEQQPWNAALAPNTEFDAALRRHGIVCASCHVRAQQRFGPPRRAELPEISSPLPHGGFEARPEFQQSRFCAGCHQFFDDPGVNGKPVENTFAEWRASPQAEAGRTCQSCHMPDRAHLWRGIHDPEMVRSAVEVDLVAIDLDGDGVTAALVLANRDVGHAFPTYVTPRVFLAVWQVDRDGHELAGTRVEAAIGREIDFGASPWREVFDTRVAPGGSVKLDYTAERTPGAVAIVGRVTVDPDYHYRGVFESLLTTLEDPTARAQIADAHRRTTESTYTLTELRRPLSE